MWEEREEKKLHMEANFGPWLWAYIWWKWSDNESVSVYKAIVFVRCRRVCVCTMGFFSLLLVLFTSTTPLTTLTESNHGHTLKNCICHHLPDIADWSCFVSLCLLFYATFFASPLRFRSHRLRINVAKFLEYDGNNNKNWHMNIMWAHIFVCSPYILQMACRVFSGDFVQSFLLSMVTIRKVALNENASHIPSMGLILLSYCPPSENFYEFWLLLRFADGRCDVLYLFPCAFSARGLCWI